MISDPTPGIGSFLGVGLLVAVVLYAVGILLFYFVIRLAVRHGTLDAWKRLPGGPRGTDELGGPARR